MPDGERVEFAGGGDDLGIHVADVAVHALAEGIDHLLDLLLVTFHDQLDAAVMQVAHISEHVIAHRDILCGVAEADPLNPAIEMVDASFHRTPRGHCGKCCKHRTACRKWLQEKKYSGSADSITPRSARQIADISARSPATACQNNAPAADG